MGNKRRKAAIVGVAENEIIPHRKYGDYRELAVDATIMAVRDAGLCKKDIDGVLFLRRGVQPSDYGSTFIEYMGLVPSYADTLVTGGLPPATSAVMKAAWAVEAGLAKHILVIRCGNDLSQMSRSGKIEFMAKTNFHPEWEIPYGLFPPAVFGMMARKHMHEYGTTREQIAAVAVTERKHASLHPNAQMRQPITIHDVLNSRIICDPLRLLDLPVVSDGGGAFIVTSAERAKDLAKTPVYLLGYGQRSTSQYPSGLNGLLEFGHLKLTTEEAYRSAGIEARDVSVVFPCDTSTISTIVAMEEMGFCRKGEGGPFVASGAIGIGGERPINPHGGLLSYRHYSVNVSPTIEAVKQLRGECGERQVKDARIALVHHEGGFISNGVIILGRD